MDNIIAQGAEAILYKLENSVKKVRIKKLYRINSIDEDLIKTRTKREIKILQKIPVKVPKLISSGADFIEMEFIEGEVLKNVLEVKYCEKIGEMVATMHDSDIIHGDLTTSNMMVKNEEIYFIDFGLSFFSKRIEDKAVDLHLLFHALESKHYKISEEAFKLILDGYSKSPNSNEVIERFHLVELRGRNKH